MEDVTKQLQNIEFEILQSFHEICIKHDIKYFLAGGTFLGAIRHRGFIPWDDDIDVGMLREDYEKFCKIALSELPPDLVLQNFDTEPNCGLIFAKIRKKGTVLSEVYSHHIEMNQGVWIDIFPFDYIDDDVNKQMIQQKKVLFFKNLYIIKCGYKNPHPENTAYCLSYFIAKFFVNFISRDFLIKKIKKMMNQISNKTEYIYPFGGAYPKKDRLKTSWAQNLVLRDFENGKFLTIEDFDDYLKQLYGDYMKLPPIEKRTSGMHNIYEIKINENQ